MWCDIIYQMKIIKFNSKKWDDKKGYSKRVLLNDKELRKPGVIVQEVKIKVGDVAKNHLHKKQTEIFYFMTSNGYWIVNGKKITPKLGDILVIEPFDVHSVVNNTDKDYFYLCFKINYEQDDFYWE